VIPELFAVDHETFMIIADPPMSARQDASVPIRLLHSSQSSSFMAASTLCCTSSTDRTSTSSQHLWSAGICCRWSYDV